MKRRRHRIQAIFVVGIIVSLLYNGFATQSTTTSIPNTEQLLQKQQFNEELLSFPHPNQDSSPFLQEEGSFSIKILLGIPSSIEKEIAILSTYLSNLSSYAFQNACPLLERGREEDGNRSETTTTNNNNNTFNCDVQYKFWSSETSILSWWQYVQQTIQVDSTSLVLVLWVTDHTILFPPYFMQFLDGLSMENNKVVFGETPTIDCKAYPHRRPDLKACQKLAGRVVLISSLALEVTAPCWTRMNGSIPSLSTSIQDALSPCWSKARKSPLLLKIPRQFQNAAPANFWKKLVEWNDLPITVDYITAKFGRDNKFVREVRWTETALLAHGYAQTHIHAYSTFPDFILNDDQWKMHLEFLHNTSQKPKGAGYWFWKTPLLLHHLKNSKMGDIVIYADVDLRDHNRWLSKLIQRMLYTNTSLALYQVEYLHRQYTKRDVYDYYCHRDPSMDKSLMYAAGWVVVRKTQSVVAFLEEWQDGMRNYSMLNDSPSSLPNIADFDYHLHDQSILSVMLKCRYTNAYEKRLVFEGSDTLKDWEVHLFDI